MQNLFLLMIFSISLGLHSNLVRANDPHPADKAAIESYISQVNSSGDKELQQVVNSCVNMLESPSSIAFAVKIGEQGGWKLSNLTYCIRQEQGKVSEQKVTGQVNGPVVDYNINPGESCVASGTCVSSDLENQLKQSEHWENCSSQHSHQDDERLDHIQDCIAGLEQNSSGGKKKKSSRDADKELVENDGRLSDEDFEAVIAKLSNSSEFSDRCAETSTMEGKRSLDGSITCICNKGNTLDYNSCADLIQAQNRFAAAMKANEMGTQAALQLQQTNGLKSMDSEDATSSVLETKAAMANTKTISSAATSATHSQNVGFMQSIISNWPSTNNFQAKCGIVLGKDSSVCASLANDTRIIQLFHNAQGYNAGVAAINQSTQGGLGAISDAFAFNAQKKQAEALKIEYDGATKVEEDPFFCMNNPEMCGGLQPQADLSTYADQGGNIGAGGGFVVEDYETDDSAGGESSNDGSFNIADNSNDFEDDAPAAKQAQFTSGSTGGGGGTGSAGSGSANASSIQTPASRQAAMKKNGKPTMSSTNVPRVTKRKKKGSKGFRAISSTKKDSKFQYKNPFENLFNNKKESKKEVTRALAADGVSMKPKSDTSLFKRISRVHRRKYEKQQLQSF